MNEENKGAFLAEYQELCSRHGLMVGMKDQEGGDRIFVVINVSDKQESLDQAINEMEGNDVQILTEDEKAED